MLKTLCFAAVKGGVGKTTCSIMTARRLKDIHHVKVGFIDADFDNSNFSQFTNIKAEIKIIDGKEFQLYDWDGIPTFSFSLIAGREKSVSMTGDRYSLMISDVFNSSKWNVDYLVVDLPAGSSDVFRSVMQVFANSLIGNVIVAQPSMIDALYRILNVHHHFQIPVLGVIENMSTFKCPNCNEIHRLFGNGKTDEIAEAFGTGVFGHLPFDPNIPDNITKGLPLIEEENSLAVFDQICKLFINAQYVESGLFQRLKAKVDNKVGELIAQLIGKLLTFIRDDLDVMTIRRETGFTEKKVVCLTLTDESMTRAVVENVFLKMIDRGVVAVKPPKEDINSIQKRFKVDYELIMSYKTFARCLLRERVINGVAEYYDAEEAWLNGDIRVRGDGSSPKTVHAIREIIMNDEIMGKMTQKYETVLRRLA